jgi:hypothetical protein
MSSPEELLSAEQELPSHTSGPGFEEFEIGEHQVPWFLWLFFSLIIVWASISWIKFFGY